MIKLAILGSTGKTGSFIPKLIETQYSKKIKLVALLGRESKGSDLKACDGVIEFSSPAVCLKLMKDSPTSVFWVIGSTGWTASETSELESLAMSRLVLKSSNFSLGVTILNEWIKNSSHILKNLGFTVSIEETHHTKKKDSPSGTALLLKKSLKNIGFTEVPIDSQRQGDVVGDHSVSFTSANETLKLTHSAKDRSIFAQGAIEAAQWLAKLKSENPSDVGIKTLILQQN
ncbi:MAG: hypothetical protein KA715_01415 [Xanthomonadaceae bacterium]|nr:hypothetical protein [Xanthomonadaceae bacterium]